MFLLQAVKEEKIVVAGDFAIVLHIFQKKSNLSSEFVFAMGMLLWAHGATRWRGWVSGIAWGQAARKAQRWSWWWEWGAAGRPSSRRCYSGCAISHSPWLVRWQVTCTVRVMKGHSQRSMSDWTTWKKVRWKSVCTWHPILSWYIHSCYVMTALHIR